MTGFVGIDYSTRKVAMVVLPEGRGHPVVRSYESPKRMVGMEATKRMLSEFTDWAISALVLETTVLIESPIAGGSLNLQTAINMGVAAGALMQACHDYGAEHVDFVSPAFWKKNTVGVGNADKAHVREWLMVTRPDLDTFVESQDECDAMCLALLAKFGIERSAGALNF